MDLLKDILSSIKNSKNISLVVAVLVFLSVSLLVNFSTYKIFDSDGFYHIRHSWIYRTGDFLDTSFPWAQYSVIRSLGGDLWYGFHILLIPFTYFKDLILGIKMAGVAMTFLALLMFYLALKRLNVKLSIFWPLSLFLFTPDYFMVARLAVARPHPISFGLNMLLLSYLVRGSWPVILLIGFLSASIHLNQAWVAVLLLMIVNIVKLISRQKIESKKNLALIAGIIAGIFLRPHPIATLKIVFVQLVDIIFIKSAGINLDFGAELLPLGLANMPLYFLPFFGAMILLFVWMVYKKRLTHASLDARTAMWTALISGMIYLMLTLFVAGRALEFFVGYLIVLTALNLTCYIDGIKDNLKNDSSYFRTNFRPDIVRGAVIVLVIAYIGISNLVNRSGYDTHIEWLPDPYRARSASLWLEKNTKPGEIVFNTGWDRFPELFFWNHHNYYINGMDPIFLYKYDQRLYWEFHFLSMDTSGEFTCGNRRCVKEEAVSTYDVLVKDFKASYIYINPGTHPKLYKYADSSRDKFRKTFVDEGGVVFRILR